MTMLWKKRVYAQLRLRVHRIAFFAVCSDLSDQWFGIFAYCDDKFLLIYRPIFMEHHTAKSSLMHSHPLLSIDKNHSMTLNGLLGSVLTLSLKAHIVGTKCYHHNAKPFTM